MAFCTHATLMPHRPLLTLTFKSTERQISAPVAMNGQFSKTRAELTSKVNATELVPSIQPQLVPTNGNRMWKPTAPVHPAVNSKYPTSNNPTSAAPMKAVTQLGYEFSYEEHDARAPSHSPPKSFHNRQNGLNPQQSVSIKTVMRSDAAAPISNNKPSTQGPSRIPRAQATVRPPVLHQVRVYDATNSQWYPGRPSSHDVKTKIITTNPVRTDYSSFDDRAKLPPTKMHISGRLTRVNHGATDATGSFQTALRQLGPAVLQNQSLPVPASLNSASPRAATNTLTVSKVPNKNGYTRDMNRVTIVREHEDDSTVNSELSDFESEQSQEYNHMNAHLKGRSVFLYPKTLNERTLSTVSEDVACLGPDQELKFVQRDAPFIGRSCTHGLQFKSTDNLAPSYLDDCHQHLHQQSGQLRRYAQPRVSTYGNQYKSTPNLFHASKMQTPSRIPCRATSQDPVALGNPKQYTNVRSGMQHNSNPAETPGYVHGTILETDYSDEETDTYNEEPSSMYDIHLYQSRDCAHLPATMSQPSNFPVAQMFCSGYPMVTRTNRSPHCHMTPVNHVDEGELGYGKHSDKLLVYDRPNAFDPIDDQNVQAQNMHKSCRTFTADHRQRGNQYRRFSSGLDNGHSNKITNSNDSIQGFDGSFYDRRRSVNLPQDFEWQKSRWCISSPTKSKNHSPSGMNAQKHRISASVSNQMHQLMNDPNYVHIEAPPINDHLKHVEPPHGRIGRKTYSEWDLSRIPFDEDYDLHPDSYLHTRPNIRRGFGGNYTRPNAGLPRVELNGKTNGYGDRSRSLERPSNQSHTRDHTPLTEPVQNSFVSGVQKGQLSRQSSPATSSVYNRSNVPTRMENSMNRSSPASRDTVSTLGRPGSKAATLSATPPLIMWREKSEEELKSDDTLKQLIAQLPLELQYRTGFVLLMMSINANTDCRQGLENRLRDAFQMHAPRRSFSSESQQARQTNRSSVLDEAGNEPETKFSHSGHADLDSSSDELEKLSDPHLPQSCNQSCNLPSQNSQIKPTANNLMVNGHSGHSDNSMESDEDGSVSNRSINDSPRHIQPALSTVLRLLAQCLLERLTCKRHHLADAEQRVMRNSNEEKWLRNKLNEVFIGSEHNSCTNLMSSLDERETPFGKVVVRFDRWHHSMTEAVILLCQLSRRLAYLDARIASLSLRIQAGIALDDEPNRNNPQLTLNNLEHQQHQLQEQLKEAQQLRNRLDNCRIRLLESIPPGLKIDEGLPSFNSRETSSQSLVPNGTSEKQMAENSTTAPVKAAQESSPPIFLRDFVSSHLTNTIQGLITYHVLSTEIRLNQEICNQIQDQ